MALIHEDCMIRNMKGIVLSYLSMARGEIALKIYPWSVFARYGYYFCNDNV